MKNSTSRRTFLLSPALFLLPSRQPAAAKRYGKLIEVRSTGLILDMWVEGVDRYSYDFLIEPSMRRAYVWLRHEREWERPVIHLKLGCAPGMPFVPGHVMLEVEDG